MTAALAPIPTAPQSDEPRPRRRLRVLVSAFAVSPVRGSEPAGGWHIPRCLAAHHDVTVLCAPDVGGERYREEVEAHLAAHGPIAGLSFHFVDRPPVSRLLQREGGGLTRPFYYWGYAAWQRAAFRAAGRLHARAPFDVVHQLNITGYREPGYLWRLPGVPFVWGPVGGASNLPAAFLPELSAKDRLTHGLRNAANEWQKRTARRPRLAARAARHVWVTSADNRRMVRERWGREADLLIDGGSSFTGGTPRTFDATRPLRVVWSGLHIARKALPVLLRALPTVIAAGPVEVTVLGDGPLNAEWRRLAERLGVAGAIRWTGQLPHDRAVAEVAGADVLAFTSLQEGTPFAVLEALSIGVPVVCHDACGMGVAVDDTCGVKVALRDPAASAAGFGQALAAMQADPSRLRALSVGALARAAELSWERRAARIAAVYERVAADVAVHGGGLAT